jgi:hypothetical protein
MESPTLPDDYVLSKESLLRVLKGVGSTPLAIAQLMGAGAFLSTLYAQHNDEHFDSMLDEVLERANAKRPSGCPQFLAITGIGPLEREFQDLALQLIPEQSWPTPQSLHNRLHDYFEIPAEVCLYTARAANNIVILGLVNRIEA